MKTNKAFTLIEILIVVCILGIIAAIIAPHFTKSATMAKEAAAKETLQMMREQLEIYKIHHNETRAGYVYGEIGVGGTFIRQLIYCTDINGDFSPTKTPWGNYIYGPYLHDFPKNPFNNSFFVKNYPDGTEIADQATGSKTNGWLYKAETGELRIDWPGTDTEGVSHYEY